MKKILSICLATSLAFTSCYDLDREPEGVLSSAKPFKTVGEMSSYLDQFYQSAPVAQGLMAGGGGGIAGNDVNSDNLAGSAVNTRIAGSNSVSSASSLSQYTSIRNVNFFLNNLDNCDAIGSPNYNQAVGEGYYFRAWYYYQLLVNYGGVAWVDTPLNPDWEEMKLPRESRMVIADHILADLDQAISLLGTKNNSASFRVHKDVARAFKSRVALFEGTWEKYHKAANDPFFDPAVTDAKINDYFTQAADAAKEVMDRGVWKIYNTGKPLNDYRVIFQTTDLSNNPEILWFKKYDGDEIGNSVNRYLNTGGGNVGVTASLVDDYLTIDGRPYVGNERFEAKKTWGTELLPTVRDPRLAQTVATPGQVLRPDQPAGYTIPPLTASWSCTTGYSLLKHVQIDYTGSLDAEYKGATPAIQVRYADVLLNYAEALAELGGAANATKIIEAIQPLRDRVGMPAMDFDREYNTDPEYPFAHLDKYVQAVRRERRVETACEGRRLEDILRWAAAGDVFVGKWHQGALYIGSDLETQEEYSGLKYDQPSGNTLYLTGNPGDPYRYINPVNKAAYPNGWQFNLNRDYLLPIQERMIIITDGLWTQNPGW